MPSRPPASSPKRDRRRGRGGGRLHRPPVRSYVTRRPRRRESTGAQAPGRASVGDRLTTRRARRPGELGRGAKKGRRRAGRQGGGGGGRAALWGRTTAPPRQVPPAPPAAAR